MRVRQDKVYAVIRDTGNWQVRQTMAFAVVTSPVFDTQVSSKDNLLALINRNVNRSVLNRDLTLDDILIEAPNVYTDEPGYNSTVVVKPKPGFHYTKSITFKYNRINFPLIFPVGDYSLPRATGTIHGFLEAINTLYGVVLDPLDVVDGAVGLSDTQIVLTAANTSPGFIPGTQFTVPLSGDVVLSAAITVRDMDGFDNA